MGQCNPGSVELRYQQQFLTEEGSEGSILQPNVLKYHSSHSVPIHDMSQKQIQLCSQESLQHLAINSTKASYLLYRATRRQDHDSVDRQSRSRVPGGCCFSEEAKEHSFKHHFWWGGESRPPTGTEGTDFLLCSAGLHLTVTVTHVCFFAEQLVSLVFGNKASR